MPVDAQLDHILQPKRLNLPARPRVLEIKAEPYVDSTGNDALLLWVILDSKTKASERRWAKLAPIERTVQDALRDAGVTFWPYFIFRTRQEYRADKKARIDGIAR